MREALIRHRRLLEDLLRRCGERYGLDDLELRDVRDLTFEGERMEIWWRCERMVGYAELRVRADGETVRWTATIAGPETTHTV